MIFIVLCLFDETIQHSIGYDYFIDLQTVYSDRFIGVGLMLCTNV